MTRALVPMAIGCVLVGIVAAVLAVVGWDWTWWLTANIALTALLLVLLRGSTTGADPDRPPGAARVSAARVTGPFDLEMLGSQGAGLEPGPAAAAATRAEDVATGFALLWTAAAPAVAAVLTIVLHQ